MVVMPRTAFHEPTLTPPPHHANTGRGGDPGRTKPDVRMGHPPRLSPAAFLTLGVLTYTGVTIEDPRPFTWNLVRRRPRPG